MQLLTLNQIIQTHRGQLKVDLSIGSGEIIILQGDNGVGKSSFIQFVKTSIYPASSLAFAFCDQHRLSSLNQITTGKLLDNFCKDFEIELNIWNEFHQFWSEKNLATPINELSGGENQWLKLQICLSQNAKLFFLDEPTQFLDLNKKEVLKNILSNKQLSNSSIFIVEHDLNFIRELNVKKLQLIFSELEYILNGL